MIRRIATSLLTIRLTYQFLRADAEQPSELGATRLPPAS